MQASIIIATKNGRDRIGDAIRSALAQTLSDIEVIVVDDGSLDGTGEMVRELQKLDRRVVLLQNADSQGVSAARNKALDHAKGDWIAVLDDDDEYTPERLVRLISSAEAGGFDMLGDNLEMHEFTTKASLGLAFPHEWMRTNPISLAELISRDMPGISEKKFGFIKPIIRRDFLLKHSLRYRPEVFIAEDFLLYAQCVLAGARYGVIDEAHYKYAIRHGSSSKGSAVYLQLSNVNRLLTDDVRRSAPEFLPLLQLRQCKIDYTAFAEAAKARRLAEAFGFGRRIPVSYLLKRLLNAAGKIVNRGGRCAPSSNPAPPYPDNLFHFDEQQYPPLAR